jgi:hypothetical protein
MRGGRERISADSKSAEPAPTKCRLLALSGHFAGNERCPLMTQSGLHSFTSLLSENCFHFLLFASALSLVGAWCQNGAGKIVSQWVVNAAFNAGNSGGPLIHIGTMH